MYADDGAFIFDSRQDLEKGTETIFQVAKLFGLSCHCGRDGKKSKTEAMCILPTRKLRKEADLSNLEIDGGIVPFTDVFKYLGGYVSHDLNDRFDVDARIKAASAAFASAKSFFTSKQVGRERKKVAYEGLILNILLYGCESWALTKFLRNRLEMFHNRCIRAMCRVTRKIHQDFHVKLSNLEKQLNVSPFALYLARRRLRWAGCVARMDFHTRLPRKLLSSWFPKNRAIGRPQMAYGHGLKSDLKNAGICVSDWHKTALDKDAWDEILLREDIHNRSPEVSFDLVGTDFPPLTYAQVISQPSNSSSNALSLSAVLTECRNSTADDIAQTDPSDTALTESSDSESLAKPPSVPTTRKLLLAGSSDCKKKSAPIRRSARLEAKAQRRSSRIAAQSLVNGGRRIYS